MSEREDMRGNGGADYEHNESASADSTAAEDLFFDAMPQGESEQPPSGDTPVDVTADAAAAAKQPMKARVPKRCKKKRLRRPVWRVVRFLLILLLGILVGYASIAGAIYYAVAGLTIDDLQKLGIAKGVDEYLTEDGEVDLTATSILGLLRDLDKVRAEISTHSIQTLMMRYGLVLPAETLEKLPPALLTVPLSEMSEGNALNVIASNVNCDYLLSLLPAGLLHPHIGEKLQDRPLSLLLDGKYAELLAGVKLGYLTGVTFDENEQVLYANPDAPTAQECLALLDVGSLIGAISTNGDIMAVLAADLAEQDVAPILAGFMSGALFEKMCEGHKISDVLLPHPETGRYTFSLTALTEHVYLGDALGYTLANGVWYSTYTDDGEEANDVAAPAMQQTLADIKMSEVIGGTLSVEETFAGLYFGDLQNGYTKGDAIYTPDPEGGEPIITGYEWLKNGEPVGKIQNKIANLMVEDLFGSGLDINATLGDLSIGDLQGYTRGADNRWYRTVAGESAPQYVGAVQNAIAAISLSDVLNGQLDIVAALGSIAIGEVQGYTRGTDNRWYRTVAGESAPQYVGAVQNALAGVTLSSVLEGNFSISETLSGLLLGDVMGYERGAVITPADPTDPTSCAEYAFTGADGKAVQGAMLEIANIQLSHVLDGTANFEGAIKDMPLGEVFEYTRGNDGVWYKVFVAQGSDENKPATGILAVLSDKSINEIQKNGIDDITLGSVLGYRAVDENTDGVRDGWLDESNQTVTGMMAVLSDLTVGDLSDDDALLQAIRSIRLGDAIGYEKRADVWYDGDSPATGAMAHMASLTIGELKNQHAVVDKIGEMQLGVLLDYQWNGQEWISGKTEQPATGMMEYLLGMQLKDVESHTNDMPLGYAFGYHLIGGQWSTDPKILKAPTGMTAVLADIKLSDVEKELNKMPLGRLLGYTQSGDEWYKEIRQENEPVKKEYLTGITLAIATLSVADLSDATKLSQAIQTVKLGDAMGYRKNGQDGWLNGTTPVTGILGALASSPIADIENDIKGLSIGTMLGYAEVLGEGGERIGWKNGNADVTGMMAVLADCKADEIESKLNGMKIGTLLGFTQGTVTSGEGEPYEAWFDGQSTEVKGLLATVADESVASLPGKINHLTVADVFDKPTGILAAIKKPEEVLITNIGTEILKCSVNDLVRAKVVSGTISSDVDFLLTKLFKDANWKENKSLEDILQALFGDPKQTQ